MPLLALVLVTFPLPIHSALADTTPIAAKSFFATPTVVGSMTSADLDKDGINEVVVGAPKGDKPYVKIFTPEGAVEKEFYAYAETFMGGVNVATCDLVPGGDLEIITGAGHTGSPHIRAFTSEGAPLATSFSAYSVSFKGGVNVGCGDIDADGSAEIVTGPGPSGGPHIKVFSASGAQKFEVFAGSASESTGAYVTVGDVNGLKGDEIITAPTVNGIHTVTVLGHKNKNLALISSFVKNSAVTTASPISLADLSADAGLEIILTNKTTDKSTITAYTESGLPAASLELPGVAAGAVVQLNNELFYADTQADGDIPITPQFILVDISEQKIRLYEYGIEVKSFLVSTGKPGYRTPTGKTTIMKKIPVMAYAWNYGENDPRNYNIPGVKWNMRVFKHIYIHSATWHNNFGRPVSHGCINMSTDTAAIVYEWAHEGTPVEVRQ